VVIGWENGGVEVWDVERGVAMTKLLCNDGNIHPPRISWFKCFCGSLFGLTIFVSSLFRSACRCRLKPLGGFTVYGLGWADMVLFGSVLLLLLLCLMVAYGRFWENGSGQLFCETSD
jgi:hypothetical protein